MLALIAGVLVATGCGPAASGPAGGTGLSVVTTTTVFADLIRNVGGDLVSVTSLVPAKADVHTFAPSPSDVRAVAGARLLVMNGLGLDDWLRDTIVNAAASGTPLVQLGVDLPGVELLPGEEPGTQNPHLWMAVPYAIQYVGRIEAALAEVDPAHAPDFARQADAFQSRLAALDRHVREQISAIPAADRKLVTFHDAFPYFAREYGIEIVGVAVEAPGQDPSAAEIASLIRAIKAAGVKAIFSESQFPTSLVDQIARETGAKVVAQLYDDSLGDPPVTSYEALIQWDVDQLVGALT
jgi:ABC-type Zn uptake system ZnuABC Zn-binding protein ZnuA